MLSAIASYPGRPFEKSVNAVLRDHVCELNGGMVPGVDKGDGFEQLPALPAARPV
jgi:hypothetical protein